jgi:CAAX prenyl protease-like protein
MPSESTKYVPAPTPTFPWRVFWALLAGSVAGAGAVIPLFLEIFRPMIQKGPPLPMPLPALVAIGIIQNLLLFAVVIGLGLLLARKLDLGAPLLEGWLYHEKPRVRARESLKYGALSGLGVGLILLVIIIPAAPHLPGLPFVSAARVAVWKRLLVCLYGGIDEEILTRLFLLSLIAWLGMKLARKEKGRLSPTVFWVANVIVAIAFGLGHLPSASLVMQITPGVVAIALVLNGIAAVPFGYLYWKRGLEAAMIAHFCADFVVYVVGPAFLKTT